MARHGAPPPGDRSRADGANLWRKLTPQANRPRKGVKARCTWRGTDGRRCRSGPVPGTGLCGPHLEADERIADTALVALAAAFGTADDPVTVRLVAHRQPAAVAELLTATARDIERGRKRTGRYIARVHAAAARRGIRP
jgi:hypothetical protein